MVNVVSKKLHSLFCGLWLSTFLTCSGHGPARNWYVISRNLPTYWYSAGTRINKYIPQNKILKIMEKNVLLSSSLLWQVHCVLKTSALGAAEIVFYVEC